MIALTLDLGTSATKAALWDGGRLVEITRSPLTTMHPAPGRAEQDPATWWGSVVDACDRLRGAAPECYDAVDVIGCAAARETFALFDASLTPLGPGILWSDQRAVDEVAALGESAAFRASTGVMLTPGCSRAKVRWVMVHERDAWRSASWLLSPRNVVVARLTGEVVTDETLASRTGCYDLDGALLDHDAERLLPPVVPSTTVLSAGGDTAALGLHENVRVVVGGGDRACEVLGVGATTHAPMVSWGTTANVSVPDHGPVATLPTVAQVSRGALGGFLIEAGLSAAGAAIAWLARLTGSDHDDLLRAAASVPPGAHGVLALPWLAGARAPWWQPEAHAAFLGLTDAHGAPELARAVVEGVAYDVARCLELVAPEASELALAGGGAADALWREVIGGVTGLPVVRRAVDDAASVGARLLVAAAVGEVLPLDDVNPVKSREEPERALVGAYASRRETADASASAVIDSSSGGGTRTRKHTA